MPKESFRTVPIPKMRRFALDAGYLGRRRHIVHGLLEVDVTRARALIQRIAETTGTRLSFTAYVVYCLAQAIERHPHLHAYRDWRNRLVIFDDIHINVMFETDQGGRKIPVPHIFRQVNRRTLLEIHQELRTTKQKPQQAREAGSIRILLSLPAFIRRAFYWVVMAFPHSFRSTSTSVLVTAVGMFGQGGGWAITMPNFTLTVVVGGISRKPGVVGDNIQIREFLDLTLSIDHDVVDGAPAARFANDLRQLLEEAQALEELLSAA